MYVLYVVHTNLSVLLCRRASVLNSCPFSTLVSYIFLCTSTLHVYVFPVFSSLCFCQEIVIRASSEVNLPHKCTNPFVRTVKMTVATFNQT